MARAPPGATLAAVTERPSIREDPALRLALALLLAISLSAAPVVAAPPGAPGAKAIARADALAAKWGRCPTAASAQRILIQAKRTTAPRPRARRARAALRSWTEVSRVCARPVDQPIVIVSA